jgi:hypothetical protein
VVTGEGSRDDGELGGELGGGLEGTVKSLRKLR